MRQPLTIALFCAALTLVSSQVSAAGAGAAAEPEPEPAAEDDIENIVVTGQRPGVLRQMMNDFILDIGVTVSGNRGYARWRHPLCVGVFNLPDAQMAQYIADKITLVALDVGMKTESPGCEPNVKIVFSPNGRELATQLVDATPSMFMPYGGTEGTTQGLAALERFKTSDAPVRWWQVTMVVDEFGHVAIVLPDGTGGVPTRATGSRLKATTNDEIWGSLIIVDVNKLGTAKFPQLAEYLAMVALAQIDPDGAPGGDTILGLFSAERPPSGLTEVDLSYLRALYAMDTMMTPHTQRGIFSNRMVQELGELKEE